MFDARNRNANKAQSLPNIWFICVFEFEIVIQIIKFVIKFYGPLYNIALVVIKIKFVCLLVCLFSSHSKNSHCHYNAIISNFSAVSQLMNSAAAYRGHWQRWMLRIQLERKTTNISILDIDIILFLLHAHKYQNIQ